MRQAGLVSCGVPGFKSFLKYWLPILIWMTLIFSASADSRSAQHSSRIIGPLVRWLFPGASEVTVDRVVFTVRKAAHVTEYAILSVLLWRAWRKPARNDNRPWGWPEAAFALAVTVFYSASDELHQALVPNREGRFGDVLLDTTGAALGLFVVWALGRWRKCW
jgi:VanZ family protein